jgi:hypothetical protein
MPARIFTHHFILRQLYTCVLRRLKCRIEFWRNTGFEWLALEGDFQTFGAFNGCGSGFGMI